MPRLTLLIWLILPLLGLTQPTVFKSKDGRYGLSNSGKVVAPAVYDTIYLLDEAGTICLGCQLKISSGNNKLFKVTTKSYLCNYRTSKGELLRIRTETNDTNSVFTLSKNTVTVNLNGPFAVAVHNKKYLVDRNFRQITFKGHYDVAITDDPNLFVIEDVNEAENRFSGLIDRTEKVIFPARYSGVHVNAKDSLFILCSAGIKNGAEDEIYDYNKRKVFGSLKHIHLATPKFVVMEVFEPTEYFVIANRSNRVEKKLEADEVVYYTDEEIRIRIKTTWYVYNMTSGEKKQIRKK
jgi:hypothetical protein